MLSLKKRLAVGVALVLMFVATILPAAAQDNQDPAPTPNTPIVTLQITRGGGAMVLLSLPVRCGNDC